MTDTELLAAEVRKLRFELMKHRHIGVGEMCMIVQEFLEENKTALEAGGGNQRGGTTDAASAQGEE